MFAPGDRITMRRFAETRLPHVNEQLGLGLYSCPRTPANLAPAPGARVSSPALLQASPYAHSATPGPAHVSTTWLVRASSGAYTAPAPGARVSSPALLQASPYAHSATPGPAHVSTTWLVRASSGAYTAPAAR